MCGKFTAKASWTKIVDFAWSDPDPDDRLLTYRVMGAVPVIVQDGDTRRVIPMRWGFPHPKDWKRPQPIHARGETIDSVPAFADAFRDGQRGIVIVETFNEAPESGEQHVVKPAGPIGIAFLWRRFEVAEQPEALLRLRDGDGARQRAAHGPAHRPHAGDAGRRKTGRPG